MTTAQKLLHGWGGTAPTRARVEYPSTIDRLDAVCAAAHAAGLRLDTWTCDDPEVARRFAAAGVDALITNVPDIILAALS